VAGLDHYEIAARQARQTQDSESCLYIKRLADVDVKILEELVRASVKDMQRSCG